MRHYSMRAGTVAAISVAWLMACSGGAPGPGDTDTLGGSTLEATEQLTFSDHSDDEPRICGGVNDRQCGGDDVCLPFFAIGCPGPGVYGLCIPPPQFCFPVRNPVCGCDGSSYANICEAVQAGTSVAHRGECEDPGEPMCGGEAGTTCPGAGTCVDETGELCDRQDETCVGMCECKMVEKCEPREVWDMDPAVCGCVPAPVDACSGVECPDPARQQCVVQDDGTTSCEAIGEK